MRLYFSTTPVRSPLERPSKLQLVHARLPPGFAPSATSQRPSQVHAAFYRQGALQTYWFCQGMTCSQVENDLLLVSDSGNGGKKISPLTEVKLMTCWWLHCLKKVPSDSPGLANHLAGHLTFKVYLPDGHGQVQLSNKILSIQARSGLAQAKCESVLPRGRAGIQVIFDALYLSRCLASELHRTNGCFNSP